jgi:hypothetical protein
MPETVTKELTSEDVAPRFERLLMCSVTERFALMWHLGVDPQLIRRLDMQGAPDLLASKTLGRLENWYAGDPGKTELQRIYTQIMTIPLPQGIPDIQ